LDLQANLFLEQLKELSGGLKELQKDAVGAIIPEKTPATPPVRAPSPPSKPEPVASTTVETVKPAEVAVAVAPPKPPVVTPPTSVTTTTASSSSSSSLSSEPAAVAFVEPVISPQEFKPEPPKVEVKAVEPPKVEAKVEPKVEPVVVAAVEPPKVEIKAEIKEEEIIRPAVAGKVAPKPAPVAKAPVVLNAKIETFEAVKAVSEVRMPSEGVAVKDIPVASDLEVAKAQASIAKSFQAFAVKEEVYLSIFLSIYLSIYLSFNWINFHSALLLFPSFIYRPLS